MEFAIREAMAKLKEAIKAADVNNATAQSILLRVALDAVIGALSITLERK